jgi:hypothetical protein
MLLLRHHWLQQRVQLQKSSLLQRKVPPQRAGYAAAAAGGAAGFAGGAGGVQGFAPAGFGGAGGVRGFGGGVAQGFAGAAGYGGFVQPDLPVRLREIAGQLADMQATIIQVQHMQQM